MAVVRSKVSRGLPTTVKPMLARLSRHPFDSAEHFFELKWDGIRAMAFLEDGRLRLLSRTSRDITGSFPELADLPSQVGARGVVLDGELVCLDSDGRPSFPLLQRRLSVAGRRGGRDNPVHFIAFDLLYLEGRSMMAEPLYSRKSRLHEIIRPSDMAQLCDLVDGDGAAFFQATCQHGLEGIVAKEKSSPYLPGRRSRHWLKVKRVRESEFVIGGYTFAGGNRDAFDSLLLGLYDDEKRLVFVGQVSAGLSGAAARELGRDLQRIHVEECPFGSLPRVRRLMFWCRPQVVCQVEYGEFSEDGELTYPMFKALRDDKSPGDCIVADAPGWPKLLADFT
ncbi:MAG: non-homologous end-joining DNA ligase [Dehalococcoidia bacterium]|nr:non-homologous end-joining DNA ligase [Dehalococcoidia bacterium]